MMFLSDKNNLNLISKEEIEYALNPEHYLGATNQIIERVVKKLERT